MSADTPLFGFEECAKRFGHPIALDHFALSRGAGAEPREGHDRQPGPPPPEYLCGSETHCTVKCTQKSRFITTAIREQQRAYAVGQMF